jgi:hypothetical protein
MDRIIYCDPKLYCGVHEAPPFVVVYKYPSLEAYPYSPFVIATACQFVVGEGRLLQEYLSAYTNVPYPTAVRTNAKTHKILRFLRNFLGLIPFILSHKIRFYLKRVWRIFINPYILAVSTNS